MIAARPSVRQILRASALEVGFLAAAKQLPRVSAEIAALAERDGAVEPTRELAERLSYLIAWERTSAVGIASYYDRFDYHTMRHVREITSIAGSRRAVVELVRHIVAAAKAEGKGTMGSIDGGNTAMHDLVDRMGYRARSAWEA